MSITASQYAQFVLESYFGPSVSPATRMMRVKGPASLAEIRKDTRNIPLRRIAACLKSLIRHSIVQFTHDSPVKYELQYNTIFFYPRFPLFCQIVRHFYGELAEQVISRLFLMGRATFCDILRACTHSRPEPFVDMPDHKYADALSSCLDSLFQTQVLSVLNPEFVNCSGDSMDDSGQNQGTDNSLPRTVNWGVPKENVFDAIMKLTSSRALPTGDRRLHRKRPHLEAPDPTEVTSWRQVVALNFSTFEAMWRDRLIVKFAEERLGEVGGDILSRLLCIATAAGRETGITSPSSGCVSRAELTRSLPKIPDFFDSYLALLTENETGFLTQEPGLGGYMYSCPYKRVIKQAFVKQVEHVVQVMFQNHGLRIFRLLLFEGPLNHEELEHRVLLPQKDFRRALPKMLAAGFISTTELSKSKDYTAETIYCLYSVKLPQIARLLIELAQHTVLRMSLRARFDFNRKQRLIEQRYRVELLIQKYEKSISELLQSADAKRDPEISDPPTAEDDSNLLTQHRESLDSLVASITPAEQQQLCLLTRKLGKLAVCEQECHVTWFIADVFLRLHT